MTDLATFPITRKWRAQNPAVLQLYSLTTPNGIKVSAMLEETGLEYEAHRVSFDAEEQFSPEFLSLNPNNKIPAILDPNGPDGRPMGLWESGAILLYLAEKTGKLLSQDPRERHQTVQWLMFQMGGIGPMIGQLGFFHKFDGSKIDDKRPLARYRDETIRLLGVLDGQLAGGAFVTGDAYSIADIAIWPWIRNLNDYYDAGELVGLADFKNVTKWLGRCLDRPASERAVNIPARP